MISAVTLVSLGSVVFAAPARNGVFPQALSKLSWWAGVRRQGYESQGSKSESNEGNMDGRRNDQIKEEDDEQQVTVVR